MAQAAEGPHIMAQVVRPPAAAQVGPPILADLVFADPALEAAYQRRHRRSKAASTGRFALFRCVIVLIVAARMLLARDTHGFLMLTLSGLLNFVPLVAFEPRFSRLVDAILMATDVLQALVGAANSSYIAPIQEVMSPFASLVYVVHGSCVLWPLAHSAFSPLPFRLQLRTQALVCIIILGFTKRICTSSWGLRCGYSTLVCLLGRSRPGGRPLACLTRLACLALDDDAALLTCRRWQAGMLLLPGFVGATWHVYRSERRLRLAFLSSREAREVRMALAMPSATIDFCLNFALPATLALWTFAGWPAT